MPVQRRRFTDFRRGRPPCLTLLGISRPVRALGLPLMRAATGGRPYERFTQFPLVSQRLFTWDYILAVPTNNLSNSH